MNIYNKQKSVLLVLALLCTTQIGAVQGGEDNPPNTQAFVQQQQQIQQLEYAIQRAKIRLSVSQKIGSKVAITNITNITKKIKQLQQQLLPLLQPQINALQIQMQQEQVRLDQMQLNIGRQGQTAITQKSITEKQQFIDSLEQKLQQLQLPLQ